LNLFQSVFFSTGAGIGAIIAAVSIEYGHNRFGFILASVVPVGLILVGLFLNKEFED